MNLWFGFLGGPEEVWGYTFLREMSQLTRMFNFWILSMSSSQTPPGMHLQTDKFGFVDSFQEGIHTPWGKIRGS